MGLPTGPVLLMILLCEDIVSSIIRPDRVSVQRIIQSIQAPGFPAPLERLTVLTIWTGGRGVYPIEARLIDPDGQILDAARFDYQGRSETQTHMQSFTLGGPNLLLPGPGRYFVHLMVDDRMVYGYPLNVFGPEEDDDGKD